MENRKEFIMKDIKSKLEWLKRNTPHNVVYIALQGSQNYNLDIYTDEYQSDIDVKAIILPTLDDVLKGSKMVSHTYVMEDNSHIDVKDIRLYIDLWSKANPSYLEILFTEYSIVCNSKFKKILDMADDIAKMNEDRLLSSIKGMAYEKRKALQHPYPTIKDKIEKYGYDPKQLHHLLRLFHMMSNIFLDGKSFKESLILSPEFTQKLKEVKLGCFDCFDAIILADGTIDIIKARSEDIRRRNNFEFNDTTYHDLKTVIYDIIKTEIVKEIKKTDKDFVDFKRVKQPMKDTKGRVRELLMNDGCTDDEMVEYDLVSYYSLYNHWEK